jgi:hypothetical protein
MQSVTVDEAAANALGQLTGMVEVRDENGTVLGYYAPVPPEHAARYAGAASGHGLPPNGTAPQGGPPLPTAAAPDRPTPHR